jgi:glycosyltransferase involved in cell wall biosynthesis
MFLRDGIDALVADSPVAFAEAILRLSHDEGLWLAISDEGVNNVRQHFSVEGARLALRHALASAE